MSTVVPTTSGKPFCEVTTDEPATSNLQLFSLRQACRYWGILTRKKRHLSTAQITEYLVFITICAGTSISQLLGQNATHRRSGMHVQTPKPLFDQVFGAKHPKRNAFRDFIDVYDDCRHFGSPKYPSIASLTQGDCQRYLDLVVDLWDEIVRNYIGAGADPDHDLADFMTVRDLVS